MKQFKKAKVILLPTGFIARRNEIGLQAYKTNLRIINNTEEKDLIFYQQHLYIISDDEIKEGDWKYDTKLNIIIQHGSYVDGCKKIIATTDTSLRVPYNNGDMNDLIILPQPSQQFIEKFIEKHNKGNIITDILVEYEDIIYNPEKDREYQSNDRINIEDCDKKVQLKINPKDNTITIKKLKEAYTKEELCQVLENLTFFIWSEVGIHYPISLGIDAKDKFINNEL